MIKKIISLVLVAVLLVPCLGMVSVTAEGSAPALSYSVSGSYALNDKTSVSKELFNIEAIVDASKVAALDGESAAYTFELKSVVANDVDYLTDPDAFFASFDAEDYAGTDLNVTLDINFESDKVFGTLDYKINVTGFMSPLSIGMGSIDEALSNVSLPTDIVISGNVWEFPKVDTITILQKPTRQDYLDNEKFDFSGTSIQVCTKRAIDHSEQVGASGALETVYTYEAGYTGIINYNSETANMFSANPSKDEKLNINSTEVVAYFDGIQIAKLPVHVDHAWSSDYVSITTDLYTDTKPGYHAIVCDGCGEAHSPEPHEPSPAVDSDGNILYDEKTGEPIYWTSNNDQTFLKNGTESSICSTCGAVLTRNALGTADYNDQLANYHFIRVILDYVNALLRIIYGSIG